VRWGAEVAPAIDQTRGIEVGLYAKDFRARALMPFVGEAVNELDGQLDADAKLHIKPGLKDGNMDGAVELRRGRIEIPAIGEELHDAHLRVDIKPWGTVNVRD